MKSAGVIADVLTPVRTLDVDDEPIVFNADSTDSSSGVVEVSARSTSKGEFIFAKQLEKGRQTADVLPELVYFAIAKFEWSKSMRWAYASMRWVRPIHQILAVFDEKPLAGGINTGHTEAFFPIVKYLNPSEVQQALESKAERSITFAYSHETVGHRFLAPEPFEVKNFADYREKLRAAYVID